jgi:hypothetical protein
MTTRFEAAGAAPGGLAGSAAAEARDGRALVEDHRWLLHLFGSPHPLRVLLFAAPLGAALLSHGLSLLPGVALARLVPESGRPYLAWGAVLGEVLVIAALARWVYPLLPSGEERS